MRCAITGSHGLIGEALVEGLEADGHTITRLGRDTVPDLRDQDAVINLAGASIAGGRWTAKYKKTIRSSRLDVTGNVVTALNREAERGHSLTFLSGSAVGFYGSRTSEYLTERSTTGSGFLADVCLAWEATAMTAHASHRTVLLRTGHVLSRRGGLLGPQRPLFQAGLGGPLGNGTQFMPWIMREDYVRAVRHILATESIRGPVNMTSPNPVRQREFAEAFARSLGRPALVRTPAWAPRLVLGREMTEEMLLSSQRAVPTVLEDSGFEWKYTMIQPALDSLTSASPE